MNSPKGQDLQEYEYLQVLYFTPNRNPTSLSTLDLSAKQHTTLPPPRLLFCFSSLRILSLAYNRIGNFRASKLLQGAPYLEDLNLSYNKISRLDDLIDLGASPSLKKLNIIGNPVNERYIRIRLIEFLLFPKKFQAPDPVKILTATYHLSSSNIELEGKPDIIISKSNSKPRSGSAEKTRARVPNGHQSQLIKLERERCPVPRKTRYPMLMVFNEEVISIRDIQSIMIGKDINGLLFEDAREKIPQREPRSDKMHQQYIEAYMKRKELKKEEDEYVPTLSRLAQIMGDNDDLRLLYSKDKMAYDRQKTIRPDYEDELWKGPEDTRVVQKEFNIGLSKLKEADKVHEEHKEKRKRKDSDVPKRVKIKVDRKGNIKSARNERSVSSLGSSVEECEHHDMSRESIVFANAQEDEEEGEEVAEEQSQVDNKETTTLPAMIMSKSNLRTMKSKVFSLSKFMREGMRSKSVLFDKDDLLMAQSESAGEPGFIKAARRTYSLSVSGFSGLDAGFAGGFNNTATETEGWNKKSNKKQKKKKFVVVKESTPNKGLPLFGYTHKQNKQSKRSLSIHSIMNKLGSFGGGASIGEQSFGRMESLLSQDKNLLMSVDLSGQNKQTDDKQNQRSFLDNSKTSNGADAEAFFTFQQPAKPKTINTSDKKNLVFLTQRRDSQTLEKPQYQQQVSFAAPSIDKPGEDPTAINTSQSAGVVVEKIFQKPPNPLSAVLQKEKEIVKIPKPFTVGAALNLFNSMHMSMVTSKSVRQFSARKKAKEIREHEKEATKFTKVIFLNRSSSAGKVTEPKRERSGPKPSHMTTREQKPLVQKTLTALGRQQSSFLASQLTKNNNHSMMYTRRTRHSTKGEYTLRTQEEYSREERRSVEKGKLSDREEMGGDSGGNSMTTMHSLKKNHSRSQSLGQISVVSWKVNLVDTENRDLGERRYAL